MLAQPGNAALMLQGFRVQGPHKNVPADRLGVGVPRTSSASTPFRCSRRSTREAWTLRPLSSVTACGSPESSPRRLPALLPEPDYRGRGDGHEGEWRPRTGPKRPRRPDIAPRSRTASRWAAGPASCSSETPRSDEEELWPDPVSNGTVHRLITARGPRHGPRRITGVRLAWALCH